MKRLLLAFVMLMAACVSSVAQENLFNLPQLTSPKNVKVTDVGRLTEYIEEYLVTDSVTGKQDTLCLSVPEVVWQSEGEDIHQTRRAPRRAGISTESPSKMTGTLDSHFANISFYVFKFEYESVDANGLPVTLSGMAVAPNNKEASKVNNILIGTHITITANRESPSNQKGALNAGSDWSVLFAMAGGRPTRLSGGAAIGMGLVDLLTRGSLSMKEEETDRMYADYRHNFVVMADYEGYGSTSNRAHPYLYQELTARQVADATTAALYAYQHDANLDGIRLPFRDKWRSCICGYSQGGSVALATQRFLEQNHLDEEFRLTGSICGDGPYDPIATLMYYVKRDLDNKVMSMPEVLPLIVKGMLDTNPYMRSHQYSDYFNPKFIETGVMDWIAAKEKSTAEIESAFKNLYNYGKGDDATYYRDIFTSGGKAMMRNIMNETCYNYFLNIYNANAETYTSAAGVPLPTHRGVMEDLHLALASNDMTEGWQPKHNILMFHSDVDTVVPYDNARRAKNKLGNWVSLHMSSLGHDHVDSGRDFFAGDSNAEIVLSYNLRISIAMRLLLSMDYKTQTPKNWGW